MVDKKGFFVVPRVNKCILGIKLTQDPREHVKAFDTGGKIVECRAVLDKNRKKRGEWTTIPVYFDVRFVGGCVDRLLKQISKGDTICIEAELDMDHYEVDKVGKGGTEYKKSRSKLYFVVTQWTQIDVPRIFRDKTNVRPYNLESDREVVLEKPASPEQSPGLGASSQAYETVANDAPFEGDDDVPF